MISDEEWRSRAGAALRALIAAKRNRGVDWMIHSSWCSDESMLIALVRAPGARAAIGTPKVGEALEVIEWAAEMATRRS